MERPPYGPMYATRVVPSHGDNRYLHTECLALDTFIPRCFLTRAAVNQSSMNTYP